MKNKNRIDCGMKKKYIVGEIFKFSTVSNIYFNTSNKTYAIKSRINFTNGNGCIVDFLMNGDLNSFKSDIYHELTDKGGVVCPVTDDIDIYVDKKSLDIAIKNNDKPYTVIENGIFNELFIYDYYKTHMMHLTEIKTDKEHYDVIVLLTLLLLSEQIYPKLNCFRRNNITEYILE